MNKQDNKLTLSVIATLISGIALIYTLIMYHHIIFAVMGMSLLFLICAYILTQNIIAFSVAENKAMNKQLKDYINDISEQLETMNNLQSKLGKATFLYTKQTAQTVSTLENNYIESQDVLYRNLSTISNAQNKAAKLTIKFGQSNTAKLMATIRELRNQLSDTMIQGFDQIQPNNTEIVAALEDIVNYLKSQPAVPDQTLSLQLNNVAQELQNISNSLQHFQVPVQNVVESTPTQTAPPVAETIDSTEPTEETSVSDMEEAETIIEEFETPVEEVTEANSTIAETIAETPSPEEPNKQLSADEIAALFAAAEPSPNREENTNGEATATDKPEETPFTPTFTVVGKSDEYMENEKETTVPTIGDINEEPGKQLSADEIAALFAAADPAPKKEGKAVKQTVAQPSVEDASKQLSADEIAALFAAAEPAPKKDTSDEEKLMNEAIAKAEPVQAAPVPDDPNKQLSADEIAALFASMG